MIRATGVDAQHLSLVAPIRGCSGTFFWDSRALRSGRGIQPIPAAL